MHSHLLTSLTLSRWISGALVGLSLVSASSCGLRQYSGKLNRQLTSQLPNLTISDGPTYDYGAQVSSSAVVDHTFTVTNSGAIAANSLAEDATTLSAPFTYKGGVFPGAGGDCSSTLAGGDSCLIVVTYTPTALVTSNDTIRISYNTGVSDVVATRPITGTGANVAAVTISDVGYTYPATVVSAVSEYTFTVSNAVGTVDATNLGLAAPAIGASFDFKGGSYPGTGGTCTATLTSGANCTIVVTFIPTGTGLFNGTINLPYESGSGPANALRAISGTGNAPALLTIDGGALYNYGPQALLSNTDHTFTVSNSSATTAATLVGAGLPALAAEYTYVGGTFPGGGTCVNGGSVAASGSCTFIVRFTPTAAGAVPSAINLTYFDGVATQTANQPITGSGIGPAVLTVDGGASYDYSSRTLTTQTDHTFTITNTGGATATAIAVGAPAIAAPFTSIGNTCGATLIAGGTCTYSVRFTPTVAGAANSSFTFDYFDGAAAQTVTQPVQGTGIDPAVLSISDAGYNYGSITAGSGTATYLFTVTNTAAAGQTTATGMGAGAPALTDPYRFVGGGYPGTGGDCAATLAAQATCTIEVEFYSTGATQTSGVYNDTIRVAYNTGTGATTATRAVTGTIAPAAADHLALVAGDTQSAVVGTAVTTAPQVRVLDRYGNTVTSGVSLTFTPTAGGGSVAASPVVTDGSGLASSAWTLGTAVGAANNTLVVARETTALPDLAASGNATITFTASATVGAADHLVLVAGDAQSATISTAVTTAPQVRVVDRYGNTITSGVSLTFTPTAGGGSVAASPVVSNGAGLASSAWTLGTVAGVSNNTLVVARETTALPDLAASGNATITFTATATAGAVSAVTSTITGSGPVIANGVATSTVTITLLDASSNPVAGVTPTFSATDTGATNAYAACSATNVAGVSTCTMTSTRAETKALSIVTPVAVVGGNVVFVPGAANTLVFTQQPSGAGSVDTNLGQQPILALRDAFNNTLTTDNASSITLSRHTDAACSNGLGAGALSATTNPLTVTAGVATFAGVQYSAAETIYIGATDGTRTACSTAINVSAFATLVFTPNPHSYAARTVGTTSAAQDFTLVNSSGAINATAVVYSLVGANPGDFTISANTCTGTVTPTPGGDCTVSVTFSPTASGARSAILRATYNNGSTGGNTADVAIDGVGNSVASLAFTAPAAFAARTVGTTSAETSVTLTNSGTTDATAVVYSLVGGNAADFAITATGTCTGTVPTGACTVTVTFTPSASGARTTTLRATYNNGAAGGQTADVALNGTGLTPATLAFSPLSKAFGSVTVGSAAAEQVFTLTNSGGTDATNVFIALTTGTGYTISANSCGVSGTPVTLAASGGNCSFTLTLVGVGGADTVTATFDNGAATGQTQTAAITGTGLTPAVLTISDTGHNYGAAIAASAAAIDKTFTVSNTGGSSATGMGEAVALTAPYSYATGSYPGGGTCGATLAASPATCTIIVRFDPAATTPTARLVGTYTDSIVLDYNTGVAATTVTNANITATLVAGAVSAATSTITGTGPVTANGVATSTVTITLLDASSNPVAGTTPTFTATDTGSTNAYSACSVSDASGVSTCTMTSTKAEVKTLSIATPVVVADGTVTFQAGPATKLVFTTQPSAAVVANVLLAQQPVIAIQDAQSNVVTAAADSVSLSYWTTADCTTTQSTGTFFDDGSPAPASGVVTYTLVRMRKAETVYIRAQAAGLTAACSSVGVVVSPAAAANLAVVSGNGQIVVVDGNATTMFAQVTDLYANPVSGVTVTWSNPASMSTGSITASSGTTDAAGQVLVDYHMGRVPGVNSVRATSAGLTGSPLNFTLYGIQGSWTDHSGIGNEPEAALWGSSTVWTGDKMIVYGGIGGGGAIKTGSVYDPIADSWTAMSAGPFRYGHSAVWTGSQMWIWGGKDDINAEVADGNSYDPASDSWAALPTAGAPPSARILHSAVWTGTEMIIWAANGATSPDGARLDSRDMTWYSLPALNAPTAVWDTAAVWTGKYFVSYGGLVWNGTDWETTDSGAYYNPRTDQWTPMAASGSPRAKMAAAAVGSKFVVFGGHADFNDPWGSLYPGGEIYNLDTDTWSAMNMSNAPSARSWEITNGGDQAIATTGTTLVVFGGWLDGSTPAADGGLYDVSSDTWGTLFDAGIQGNAPSDTFRPAMAWTGDRLLFYSTDTQRFSVWDPEWLFRNEWTTIMGATANAPTARYGHTSIWTGTHYLVWGGYDSTAALLNDGGVFDPVSNSWSAISTVNGDGAPSARGSHTTVWTGSEMIVWGGGDVGDTTNTGGQYNPATDNWDRSIDTNVPAGSHRWSHAAVWTGKHMIVWGGWSGNLGVPFQVQLNDGLRYDPRDGSWTAIAAAPVALTPRQLPNYTWTGKYLLINGGSGGPAGAVDTVTAMYDSEADTWTMGTSSPNVHHNPVSVWTGRQWILFSGCDIWGFSPCGSYTGALDVYTPTGYGTEGWTTIAAGGTQPSDRELAYGVWTGKHMIVWGGNDATDFFDDGAMYDPVTETWTTISTTNDPSPRNVVHAGGPRGGAAVWTGTEMIIWGGRSAGGVMNDDGARYRPFYPPW